ncbi:MAG: Gfo/Idh/MocA family oxidoreductase [Candidatus Helarchaeota archaeon]|nr:Gfo/Idh/MocA family oxidoreductase [Candidatus Helarchaeota archaeon]
MAVIGAGNWGKNHIRTLSGMDNVRLKSVCDIDEERLKRINENYPNIEITNDPKDIFKDSSIKGVVVASSSDAHFSLAKSALDNDKDVLVEKPLTLDSNSAEILIEKAEEGKRILMVGHLLIYHPAVKKIKELIKSGELGEIYYLYSQRINLGAIRRTESSLWSLGPHDISIALYLLEEVPNFVEAYGESYIQKDVNDVVFLNLHFPNRIIANIHISWLDPHKIRKLTIVGSKKMVVFDDMEAREKIKIYNKGVDSIDYNSFSEYISLRFGDVLIPKLEMYEPLKLEDAHFVECIQKRIKPITDGENGLKVIKILEEAEKSLRNK